VSETNRKGSVERTLSVEATVVDLYRADGGWLDWFDISGDGFVPGLNP
jgi:hypothetical protein